LINNSNTSKTAIKNYVAYHNENLTEPTLFKFPKNISDVIMSNDEKCLIFKQGKKYLNKGKSSNNDSHLDLCTSTVMEEIKKKETIINEFDSGVIITDKNLYCLFYLNNYLDSSLIWNYNSQGFAKVPLDLIPNKKDIVWAHCYHSGFLVILNNGSLYGAGRYIYLSENEGYKYDYNLKKYENLFDGGKVR